MSREVCGICWCPYDDVTGACGCEPEPAQEPAWVCPDSAEHRYQKPGHCEDCGKTLVQVAEPVQEPKPVAWLHVPYPGNAISPMLSLSKHREPSMYVASVPLYFKEQL